MDSIVLRLGQWCVLAPRLSWGLTALWGSEGTIRVGETAGSPTCAQYWLMGEDLDICALAVTPRRGFGEQAAAPVGLAPAPRFSVMAFKMLPVVLQWCLSSPLAKYKMTC